MTCWQAPLLWSWGLRRGCPRPSRRLRPQADLVHPPNSLRHLREYPLGEGNVTVHNEGKWHSLRAVGLFHHPGLLLGVGTPAAQPPAAWGRPRINRYRTPIPFRPETRTEPTAQRASKTLFSLSFQTAPGLTASCITPRCAQCQTEHIEYSACAPRTACHLRCEKGS